MQCCTSNDYHYPHGTLIEGYSIQCKWCDELGGVVDYSDPLNPTFSIDHVYFLGMSPKNTVQYLLDCEEICEYRNIQLILDHKLY
jgi:hypothetical protein